MTFELTGPGVIVGDNPFEMTESGGAGAIWIRTVPKSSGRIVVTAAHSSLGRKSAEIEVRPGG
jgi:beta-galactosidase